MSDNYGFDRSFRLRLLALMLNNNWMAKYGASIVQPAYFPLDDEIEVCKAILQYREVYGYSPKDGDDLRAVGGAEYDIIDDLYDGLNWWDFSLASDKALEFAKQQAAKLAILESVDDVNRGNLAAVVERIKKAITVGDDIQSPGIDVIDDIDKWLYDMWQNKVPTLWTHVDDVLEGGANYGDLGVILAPPNRGKTMALINIGYAAASFVCKKNVAHFTLEMRPELVSKRYAARMVFKFPGRDTHLPDYEDELRETARKLMPGKIRVIGVPRLTVAQIDSHLARLDAEDFDTGLVVVDYPDLMTPTKYYSERRFELSATYTELRELAGKRNIPFWGATQGNRDSFSKEVITMQQIAEDIGKAAISDIIIAICQTWEEAQANLCRLFMAKVRDGRAGQLIDAKYYSESQAIVTTGYTQVKDDHGNV